MRFKFSLVHEFVAFQNLLIEQHLQALVGKIDTKLFEAARITPKNKTRRLGFRVWLLMQTTVRGCENHPKKNEQRCELHKKMQSVGSR